MEESQWSERPDRSTWSTPPRKKDVSFGLGDIQSRSQPSFFASSTKDPLSSPGAFAPIDGIHFYEEPDYDPWARRTVLSLGTRFITAFLASSTDDVQMAEVYAGCASFTYSRRS